MSLPFDGKTGTPRENVRPDRDSESPTLICKSTGHENAPRMRTGCPRACSDVRRRRHALRGSCPTQKENSGLHRQIKGLSSGNAQQQCAARRHLEGRHCRKEDSDNKPRHSRRSRNSSGILHCWGGERDSARERIVTGPARRLPLGNLMHTADMSPDHFSWSIGC